MTWMAAIGGLLLFVALVRFGLRWLGYVLIGWFAFGMWFFVMWLSPPLVAWGILVAPFACVGYLIYRRRHEGRGVKVPARRLRRHLGGVAWMLGTQMKIRRWEPVADGVRLAVTLKASEPSFRAMAPPAKAAREAEFSKVLGARDVTISPDAGRGDWGYLTIHRLPTQAEIDWLADVGPWPGCADISKPIPIGLDEKGRVVTVTMLYNNLLIGGIPGAGKSVAMAMVMATAALDLSVELWTLDGGGGVEMRVWKDRASRAESKHAPGFLMLQDLKSEVDRRLEDLMVEGRMKIEPGEPTILLGIEELATFTAKDKKRRYSDGELAGPKDAGETYTEALTYIARLGRKVGVMVVANTQRPSATVVDTDFRDLLGTGLALYCKTGAASDTILGEGWRGQGYNAAKLNRSRKGSFILSPETDLPIRGRCFFLTPAELTGIADRSAESWREVQNLELCLENGENGAESSDESSPEDALSRHGSGDSIPAESSAESSVSDLKPGHLAMLRAATSAMSGPELDAASGWSPAWARKQRAWLENRMGYLSAVQEDPTKAKHYLTTLAGREQIKREEAQ